MRVVFSHGWPDVPKTREAIVSLGGTPDERYRLRQIVKRYDFDKLRAALLILAWIRQSARNEDGDRATRDRFGRTLEQLLLDTDARALDKKKHRELLAYACALQRPTRRGPIPLADRERARKALRRAEVNDSDQRFLMALFAKLT